MGTITHVPIDRLPIHATEGVRYLYVIREEQAPYLVKIGIARHPAWRRNDLQSGNHRRLELVAAWSGSKHDIRAIELCIHRLLREQHVSGEWFHVSVEKIEQLLSAEGSALERE